MAESGNVILNKDDIDRTITRLAHEIIERNKGAEDIVIIGIFTRGDAIGKRLVSKIYEITKTKIAYGTLDITLYRDDYSYNIKQPSQISNIPIIENKTVILADDVLYTGRTTRAAIDGILQYGRPSKIQLAVLIDRGHRELPIKADYVGKNIPTSESDKVQVQVEEYDKKDEVILL
jgi:pyrimidine operon attenuation protein / uracil phosphoribosyltransferase